MRAQRAQRGRSRWPSFPRTDVFVFGEGDVGEILKGYTLLAAAAAAARRRPTNATTATTGGGGAVAVG